MIEGSFGLGEAVVSGAVSPDRYVVRQARRWRSARARSHRKELAIDYAPDGGDGAATLDEREAHAPGRSADEEVVALAELGHAIEEHYGSPQDTEWAFDPDGDAVDAAEPADHDAARARGPRPGAAAPAQAGGEGRVLLRGLGGAPGGASGTARDAATRSTNADKLQRRRRAGHAHDGARLAAADAPGRARS